MSFKHINPGYASLSRDYNAYDIESYVYNPRLGRAFYSVGNGYGFRVGDRSSGRIGNLWIKFDVFLPETAYAEVSLSLPDGDIIKLRQVGTTATIVAFPYSEVLTLSGEQTNLKFNAVNTIWLHLTAADTYWSLTVMVNNVTVMEDVEDYTYDDGFISAGVMARLEIDEELPVSNLIASDEEIDPKEIIVQVECSDVETTMTVRDDGAYSSFTLGDYVLQTLDTTNLYNLFGADGTVTGMVAIAAPAYNTDKDTYLRLQCRKVDGETVTNYPMDSDADDELSFMHELRRTETGEDNPTPVIGEQIIVAANTTFASLNGVKLGWVLTE